MNFKKIKERIENLESRSKSYDRFRNRSKKSKVKLRTSNISHNKSKSISKNKSTNRKNRINKSIEDFEKDIKKRKKSRKGVLILHKSKTPLKFKSNYLSLNDEDIYNILNKNDILDKNKDKIITYELSDKNKIKKMTNMTDFANYLNNYSTQHKNTEISINNSNSNKKKFFDKIKSFSKEKIRVKYIKNNKSKNKSKSKTKSKEKIKEKEKGKKLYNPINYSLDIKQNQNENKKLYIYYNNIIKKNKNIHNVSINICNNINSLININKKENKGSNSRENPKIKYRTNIIYNQKKKLLKNDFNKIESLENIKNDKSKSKEKKKENILLNNKNKNQQKYTNNTNYDNNFIYNKYNNIYSQMKNEKIIKDKILQLIGEKDYKYIMDLYEKAFNKNEQDKIQEYFELIDKYVNENFNSEKHQKFDKYFYSLMSIDCFLNAKKL